MSLAKAARTCAYWRSSGCVAACGCCSSAGSSSCAEISPSLGNLLHRHRSHPSISQCKVAAASWLQGVMQSCRLTSLHVPPLPQGMSAADFKRLAARPEHQPPPRGHRDDSLCERAFWSSVTNSPPLYGADTPVSLFDARLAWGWNLRNLGCMLQDKRYDVPQIPGAPRRGAGGCCAAWTDDTRSGAAALRSWAGASPPLAPPGLPASTLASLTPVPVPRRDHPHELLWHVQGLLWVAQGGRRPLLHQLPALWGAQGAAAGLPWGARLVPAWLQACRRATWPPPHPTRVPRPRLPRQVWYCVSPRDNPRFEAMARALFPDLHRACHGFMRHKVRGWPPASHRAGPL
jgi:hypothetical protein